MKLNKKALLSIGTIAAVVTPIASVISCGSSTKREGTAGQVAGTEPINTEVNEGDKFDGRYNTNQTDKVIIHSTWSANGDQFKAMDKLTEKYNASQASVAGFKPVELVHIQGGYGDAASSAVTKIKVTDKSTLPNLIVDYPAAAASMRAYEMELNFNLDSDFNKSAIDPAQLRQSNNISGIQANDVVSVPLSISTEAMFIDKPLMKHLFNILEAHGATITAGASGIVKEINDTTIGAEDLKAIQAVWGNVPAATDTTLSALTVNDQSFKSYEALIELGKKVMTTTGKNAADPNNMHFMGTDSPGNLEFVLTESMKYSNEYQALVGRDGTAENWVTEDWAYDGKAKNAMMKANELVVDGLNSGALWVGGNGSYGSGLFVDHKLGITIGSTAGYYHQYDKSSHNIQMFNGVEIKGPSVAKPEYHQIGKFTNGNFFNNIKGDKVTLTAAHDKYNYKAKTAADTTAITAATTAHSYLINTSDKSFPATMDISALTTVTVVNLAGDEATLVIVPTGTAGLSTINPSQRVNLSDMGVADNIGLKAFKNSQKATVLPQGPGIVGVHSNPTGDKATTLFVNWLYSKEQVNFGTQAAPINKIPADYFSEKAKYIVPKAGYLAEDRTHMSEPNKIALASLEAATTANNNIVFTEVAIDESSQPFRKSIEAALGAARDLAHTGGTASATTIYTSIRTTAVTDEYVDA